MRPLYVDPTSDVKRPLKQRDFEPDCVNPKLSGPDVLPHRMTRQAEGLVDRRR